MADPPVQALVFDFDGTLVDSDEALVQPLVALGARREDIVFGLPVSQGCDDLGVSMDDYVELYDTEAVHPYDGVADVVPRLGRWALCSNKHPVSGIAELARLGWEPEVALFADAFDYEHKSIAPVLDLMGLPASAVVMVGDSEGDVRCAEEVGCRFAWAGWNARVAASAPSGLVLAHPSELLDLYG